MHADFEVSFGDVVHGFHVYKAMWTPVEQSTERDHGNAEDAFAVVIMKSGTMATPSVDLTAIRK